jgi:hypothetical protein
MLNWFMPFTFFPIPTWICPKSWAWSTFAITFHSILLCKSKFTNNYDGWDEKTPFAKGWLM